MQSILRAETPNPAAQAATLTVPWSVLGQRRSVGASALWAQTVSAYANEALEPEQLPRRIARIHALDPSDPEPARLAVAMLHTLPAATPQTERTLLLQSARVHPSHAWFPTALAVGMHQDQLPGHPDEPANWMTRAAREEPSLRPAARRMHP